VGLDSSLRSASRAAGGVVSVQVVNEFAATARRTYGFHMYDALVVASALAADCETLYTEDLQDGQVIEEQLTARNPFRAAARAEGDMSRIFASWNQLDRWLRQLEAVARGFASPKRLAIRATDLWVQASLNQQQRLQQLFLPEGIAFDGNRFNRTAATAPFFKYLAPGEGPEEKMVSRVGIEPTTRRLRVSPPLSAAVQPCRHLQHFKGFRPPVQ
jgi:hypothetical protein